MDNSLAPLLSKFHDNGHALLSPSGWSGWSRCTGMMVGLDESRKVAADNIASIEGTTAHTLLELCLLTWHDPMVVWGSLPEINRDATVWCDRIVANAHNDASVKDYAKECLKQIISGKYPEEMRVEIAKCYQRIKAYKDDGWTVVAESRVSLEWMFDHKHCDGTSDVVMYKANRLIVVDLKYGKGIEVSPVKSRQLSLYAGGALGEMPASFGAIERIDLVIMQPRIGNGVWKEWSTTYSDLVDFLLDARNKSIRALKVLAGQTDAIVFDPSESACMWCHRKTDCKARMDFATESVGIAFAQAGVTLDSNEIDYGIDNKTIADVLDRAPFVISFFNDMAKEAEKRARRGEVIPGRKMVKGRAARSWATPETVQQQFLDAGISPLDFIKADIKSPAQMDKVKLNGEQKTLVKQSTQFTFGKNALVLDSDSRISVTQSVAKAFDDAGVTKTK